jgi:hypothetical protein
LAVGCQDWRSWNGFAMNPEFLWIFRFSDLVLKFLDPIGCPPLFWLNYLDLTQRFFDFFKPNST